jgi:hypothetical protein
MRPSCAVREIGRRAHAALVASEGHVDRSPGIDASSYAFAHGEPIYIARTVATMHPRTVIVDAGERPSPGERIDVAHLTPWNHGYSTSGNASMATLRSACEAVTRSLSQLPDPPGFARLLVGAVPEFPLDRVFPHVSALAAAIDAGDAGSIYTASLALLGLGHGLTPSGDDLVGAALFARRVLLPSASEWVGGPTLVTDLIAAARQRTHPVSAALFADLVAGESFAPLHRLAAAFESGVEDEIGIAARELMGIGHSSGFDMLAGFVIGIAGCAALPPDVAGFSHGGTA